MKNTTVSTLKIPSMRQTLEEELDRALAEIRAEILLKLQEEPDFMTCPYAMYGRIQKENLDIGLAMCAREASSFRKELREATVYTMIADLNSKKVTSIDLL